MPRGRLSPITSLECTADRRAASICATVSAPAIPIRVIVKTAARPRARYISTTSSAITGAPFKIRVARSSSSSRSHFATTIVATPFPIRFVKDRI